MYTTYLIFQLICLVVSQTLQIHIFDVGQSDSQLIIFPSGYTILIDAGEVSTGNTNAQYITERIWHLLGDTNIDVGVATHLHQDHIGSSKGGFRYLMEKEGISFKKFIDRNSGIVKKVDDDPCTQESISFQNIGTISSTTINWIYWITTDQTMKQSRQTTQLCSIKSNHLMMLKLKLL